MSKKLSPKDVDSVTIPADSKLDLAKLSSEPGEIVVIPVDPLTATMFTTIRCEGGWQSIQADLKDGQLVAIRRSQPDVFQVCHDRTKIDVWKWTQAQAEKGWQK